MTQGGTLDTNRGRVRKWINNLKELLKNTSPNKFKNSEMKQAIKFIIIIPHLTEPNLFLVITFTREKDSHYLTDGLTLLLRKM